MSAIEDFTRKVVDKYSNNITDKIFLFLQNDKDLMLEYLDLVRHENISIDTLNQQIGKSIKNLYNLENIGESQDPNSTLIRSFTRHKTRLRNKT